MKLNKYLKIFVVCVCLLALLAVSCFATSAQTTNVVYGHYISPGEYSFVDSPSSLPASVSFRARFLLDYDSNIYYGLVVDTAYDGSFYVGFSRSNQSTFVLYKNYPPEPLGWQVDNHFFVVLDGFYIYEPISYQWWQSNIIRVSPGYSSSFFDSILSIFTSIGQWISGASANLVSMFYANEALTFVGTLSIAALAMAVSFLLIAFISRFLRFRG